MAVLEGLAARSDVIVAVDDGSSDGSTGILRDWAGRRDGVVLIALDANLGKSRALELGFRQVLDMMDRGAVDKDDLVITTDADGQIPPSLVDEACPSFETRGLDMLIGSRDFRLYPRIKRRGNAFLTWLASALSGFRFEDTLCGFRVLRASSLGPILERYRARKYSCEQELSMIGVKLGLRVANDLPVPTAHYRSNSSWSDAVQIAWDSLRTWRRLKRIR